MDYIEGDEFRFKTKEEIIDSCEEGLADWQIESIIKLTEAYKMDYGKKVFLVSKNSDEKKLKFSDGFRTFFLFEDTIKYHLKRIQLENCSLIIKGNKNNLWRFGNNEC